MEHIIVVDKRSGETEIIELEERKEVINDNLQEKKERVLNRRKEMMDKMEEYYKNL